MTIRDLLKESAADLEGCNPGVEAKLVAVYRSRRGSSRGWWIAAAAAIVAAAFIVSAPKPSQPAREPVAREVFTDFYALDPGVLSGPVDGRLIRVRVPRQTMATFGLPVNERFGGDRVEADVLLGTQGTARAIRFVRQVQ